jgi:hypothetical protein
MAIGTPTLMVALSEAILGITLPEGVIEVLKVI